MHDAVPKLVAIAVRMVNTTTVLTDYCFGLGGVIIGTVLGAYIFKLIPNRIFRYIVYAYIGISGVIILLTN